jgi:cellulose synthase/poly-beta-1,6-N-acetylglucosamine synthase-like glycosyltransferase
VYPSVTIVRPIRSLDVGAEENLRSVLAQDYPGPMEILMVFDDRDDPAFGFT